MIARWRMVIASLAVGAIGCSTDAPTEVGDTSTTPPTVVATSPVNASAGNARLSLIRATFSRAVAPASVTTATFSVTHNTAIAGTVSVTGAEATFRPAAPLVPGGGYTAHLTTGITDSAGHALATSVEWQFQVNVGPTAAAGADRDANRGAAVSLDAGGMDPDPGPTLSYAWTQIAGPAVTLSGATSAATTFAALNEVATLEFAVRVSDGQDQATDSVVVWVLEDALYRLVGYQAIA
jgi:large repetitive protein